MSNPLEPGADGVWRRGGHPRRAARAILLDAEGRVLLIRSGDHRVDDVEWWELPGGGIEPGERPIDTVRRELVEETGYLDVDVGPQVGELRNTWVFWDRRVDQLDLVHVAFLRTERRQPQQLAEREIAEPVWMDRAALAAATADLHVPVVPYNLAAVVAWLTGPQDVERPDLAPPPWWPLTAPGVHAGHPG